MASRNHFADSLSSSAVMRRNGARYSNVVALLISWADETAETYGSLQELKGAFKRFNFKTETFVIPWNRPQAKLLKWLKRIEEKYSADNTLLIVAYSGHGAMQGGEMFLLAQHILLEMPKVPSIQPTFNPNINLDSATANPKLITQVSTFAWSAIQGKLQSMAHDVLIILESCEAAGVIASTDTRNSSGRTEIIAACGHDVESHQPPRRTYSQRHFLNFSSALTAELKEKARRNQSFTAASLHCDLLKRIIRHKTDLGHNGNPIPTPVYIFAAGNLEDPSILVSPLLERVRTHRREIYEAVAGLGPLL